MKPKIVRLTVYLLKASYTLKDPVVSEGAMSEIDVAMPNSNEGLLYYNKSGLKPPGWAWFLAPLNEDIISKLGVASVAVILILPAAGRHFAACFGHGYAYVDKRLVESRFGLKTCLNLVDPSTIRALDKRTFDSLGKLSHEQSTRPVTIGEFGLEVDKDLLRSVVGTPQDPSFGKQVAGRDSFGVRVPIAINQLPAFLKKCLKASKENTYKEHFEFIDNIREVNDPTVVADLEQALLDEINSEKPKHIWMAVPDLVTWEECGGFKYSQSKKEPLKGDIRLREFEEKWGVKGAVTLADLSRRVFQYGANETTITNAWTAYRCLYAEIQLKGEIFILTEGAWYNVQKSFVTSVNNAISSIADYQKTLAEWGDEYEDQYNKRIYEKSNGEFALMDRKQIRHGGGSSSIEFCDLFSKDRKIIHVKNYSGSSVLSHLFHQGTVSAVMTAGDLSFRKKVNALLPATHRIPEDGIFKTSDYEVVYAIGTREPIGFELPFFSKVSLRNSVQQLRVSGYKVSFTKIKKNKLAKID
jgi:uncharacterized protein (TIGR04141 family)